MICGCLQLTDTKKNQEEVFDLPICWSFLYAFLMCCVLRPVDTAPAELGPGPTRTFETKEDLKVHQFRLSQQH